MHMEFDVDEVFLGALSVDLRRIGATIRDLLDSGKEQVVIRGFLPAPTRAGTQDLGALVVRRGGGLLYASVAEGGSLVIVGSDLLLGKVAAAFEFSDNVVAGAHSALFWFLYGDWENDTVSVVIGYSGWAELGQ